MVKLDYQPATWGTHKEPKTPEEFLKRAVESIHELWTLPEAAVEAMEIANDPDSSMRDLSAVIERDPALATGVLKQANSPLFWCGRNIESLNQAVVLLGLRECQNLIVAVGMRSFFKSTIGAQKRMCEILWSHACVTANLCRKLNRSLRLGHGGEEFACGLVHDLGRILVAISAPQVFELVDPLDFREGPGTLRRERELLATDHCRFGAWFAARNRLPKSLISAIGFHHTPEDAGDHTALIALVATADHMANHIGRNETCESYDLAANRGWSLLKKLIGQRGNDQPATVLNEQLKDAAQWSESVGIEGRVSRAAGRR